ncbi:hypothetical protein JCM11641_001260 [Rhodosporidiobolus odoratus]
MAGSRRCKESSSEANGKIRNWKEQASKAEGRLGKKPSWTVELFLSQVDPLTSERDHCQAEVNALRAAHASTTDTLSASQSVTATSPINSLANQGPKADKLRAQVSKLESDLERTKASADANRLNFDGKLNKIQVELGRVR